MKKKGKFGAQQSCPRHPRSSTAKAVKAVPRGTSGPSKDRTQKTAPHSIPSGVKGL